MLRYEFGMGIRSPFPFFELNRKYFGGYAGRDFQDFRMRLCRTRGGMAGIYFNDEHASVLQTMRTQTSGNNAEIPATSGELTGGESYSTYNTLGDTIVLVTFCVRHEMRHERNGEKHLTDAILEELLSHYCDAEFRITYSPATRRAVKTHLRHGANPVVRLPKARPGLVIEGSLAEDVIVMGYNWPRHDLSLLREFGIQSS